MSKERYVVRKEWQGKILVFFRVKRELGSIQVEKVYWFVNHLWARPYLKHFLRSLILNLCNKTSA